MRRREWDSNLIRPNQQPGNPDFRTAPEPLLAGIRIALWVPH